MIPFVFIDCPLCSSTGKGNSEQKRQGPTLMAFESSHLQLCVLEARTPEKGKQGVAGEAQERRGRVGLWEIYTLLREMVPFFICWVVNRD